MYKYVYMNTHCKYMDKYHYFFMLFATKCQKSFVSLSWTRLLYCHKYEWRIYIITPKFTILTLLSICFNIIVILGSPRHVASNFSMHSLSLLSGNPDTFKALHNSAWVWSDVTNASSLITTEKQIDNFANHFSWNFFIKRQIC